MKNKKGTLAIAYIRCASPNEKQILEQMNSIYEYAKKQNLEIIAYYTEDFKGNALKELLRIIKNGISRVRHILMFDISRWGRLISDKTLKRYENQILKAGVEIHYTNGSVQNSIFEKFAKILKRKMAREWKLEQLEKRRRKREGRHKA